METGFGKCAQFDTRKAARRVEVRQSLSVSRLRAATAAGLWRAMMAVC
jgi:hypothetical protein